MTDQTLLSKARKARFDDLPNFSGHPSEDVERFLKSIKNITKANDESENHEILEIVRGKLIQSAGLWFDNHEHDFKKWSDFETAFRNRYFSSTMIHKKFDLLKQRKQLHNEPVTSYFDDVVNLCKEIDPTMSEQIMIKHLMSGINPDSQKELSRRESSMNTLNEFLKYAKIEQDLYDTFEKFHRLSIESTRTNFEINHQQIPSLTNMIERPKQQYQFMNKINPHSHSFTTHRSDYKRNSNYQYEPRSTFTPDKNIQHNSHKHEFKYKNYVNNQFRPQQPFKQCRICGRQNHRTIDCFHKQTTGCFNCGQDHTVRDCTMPPSFQ
ncbi:unnamed protein product [Rotaria magnacalcarata]|uniref:Retrotransposon gag domain-containing protein n=1 Tax=Rotaria magnacalcarata TaxID=392030 RepID=A0A819UHT8_9BILA|nr:unnamed protein product [Rotaria magnacalcarata]CAF4094514.1 unnamed protein product [Rotaria magnacalcarata]